jgi:hypothetical protein
MVIGYGEGDDGFPPFMVMESISGIRMDLLHNVNPPERYIEAIMEDLATIQLELYSHPFDRIGMLDLPDVEECIVQGKDPIPSLAPFSIDSWEIVRNGVILPPASTFLSSTDYYNYKLGLWAHQLETQRNSVDGTDDGKRKFLNVGILSKFNFNFTTNASDQPERFYLTHPDLHSSNVILDKKTLRVKGIVDWEGACTLPLSNLLIPPPALTSCYKYDLHPGSSELAAFDRRTLRYTEILLDLHRQEGLDHGGQQTLLVNPEHPDFMANVFLIRALDDTRCLDHMIWQHLAPHWYPELGTRIAAAIHPTDDVISDACYDSIKEIIHEFVEQQGTLLPERDRWLQRKLEPLRKYEEELAIMGANQDGNIDQK